MQRLKQVRYPDQDCSAIGIGLDTPSVDSESDFADCFATVWLSDTFPWAAPLFVDAPEMLELLRRICSASDIQDIYAIQIEAGQLIRRHQS